MEGEFLLDSVAKVRQQLAPIVCSATGAEPGTIAHPAPLQVEQNPEIRGFDDIWGRLFGNDYRDAHASGSGAVAAPFGNAELRRNDPSRPLVTLSYMLNHAAHGVWAPGFRAVNVALHAACAVLVGGLTFNVVAAHAARTARAAPRGAAGDGSDAGGASDSDAGGDAGAAWVGGAGAVAAEAFACAPINWATATYIHARSDLLCAAATLGFVTLVARERPPRAACVALFCAALCAKQTAAVALLLSPLHCAALTRAGVTVAGVTGALRRHAALYCDCAVAAALVLWWRWLYFGRLGDVEVRRCSTDTLPRRLRGADALARLPPPFALDRRRCCRTPRRTGRRNRTA